MRYLQVLCIAALLCPPASARHNSDHPLSEEDWQAVMDKVVLLEDSGFMPSLLPIIMSNRDALQLTPQQVESFRDWRRKNYTHMINIMNEIIEKKVKFSVESLSRTVMGDHLINFQAEIHALQRELLLIKLSCRELLMSTFNEAQWDNFAFVVADNPKLASLMSQIQPIALVHGH